MWVCDVDTGLVDLGKLATWKVDLGPEKVGHPWTTRTVFDIAFRIFKQNNPNVFFFLFADELAQSVFLLFVSSPGWKACHVQGDEILILEIWKCVSVCVCVRVWRVSKIVYHNLQALKGESDQVLTWWVDTWLLMLRMRKCYQGMMYARSCFIIEVDMLIKAGSIYNLILLVQEFRPCLENQKLPILKT